MVDPDSLLIFKLRSKEVVKGRQSMESLPAEMVPAQLAIPTRRAPQQEKPPAARPAEKQQARMQPDSQKPQQAPAKQVAIKPQQQAEQAKQPAGNQAYSNVLGRPGKEQGGPELKISEETYSIAKAQPYNVRPEEVTTMQQPSYPDPGVYYTSDMVQQNIYKKSYGRVMNIRNKAQSREIAQNMACSMHPWRHAYAICFTCHRPFCFEDIVEYKRGYYCTNDMSKMSEQYKARLASEYAFSNMVPALIMMATLLALIFYTRGPLEYLIGYAGQYGILKLATSITQGAAFLLADIAMVALNMAAALYAITQSRKSTVTNVTLSVIAVMLFSYQFFSGQFTATFEALVAVIAMVEFMSFAVSVHAAATRALIEDQALYFNDMYDFAYSGAAANVGRF